MKKYHGVLLALSPFFVYGILSIPGYAYEILKLFFTEFNSFNNYLGSTAQGIWIVSVWFFPLAIPMLQYTKNLFRLWLAPLNILGLTLGNIIIYCLSCFFDEMGQWFVLWIIILILAFSAISNIILSIIYIVKNTNKKQLDQQI